MKQAKRKQVEEQVEALLEGRVLARVHAQESLAARGGDACCGDLTYKGEVSDIDEDNEIP